MSEQVMAQASRVQTAQRNSASGLLQRAAITPIAHGLLQRCSNGVECPECRERRLQQEGMLQRAAVNTAPTPAVPPIVHDVLNSPGQPLDAGVRTFMEPRFGHDFSGVKVHTDARAAESARAVNALAYTVGNNVVFGAGQYMPQTMTGKRLLAHELTHVVQQGVGAGYSSHMQHKLEIGSPNDRSEHEAEQNARLIESSHLPAPKAQPTTLARAEDKTTVTVTAPSGPNACGIDHDKKIAPAVAQAQAWLNPIIAKLSIYRDAPNVENDKVVRNALKRHFNSTEVSKAQYILGKLNKINSDITSRANLNVECHDKKDTICGAAGAYVINTQNLLVFCPSFFTGSDIWRAETIIHEMAHALVGGHFITDRGYARDRVYPLLSTDEALTNAESYGLFVQELATNRKADISTPKDTKEDCDAKGFPGWSQKIDIAIARGQRWNRDAQVWASQRKPEVLQANAPIRKQYLDNDSLSTLEAAKNAYDALASALSSSIDFECEPEGGGRCQKFTTYWYVVGDFHICPSWTQLGDDDRIVAMLAGLYGYKGDVDDNRHRWQYAKLAQAVSIKKPEPVTSSSIEQNVDTQGSNVADTNAQSLQASASTQADVMVQRAEDSSATQDDTVLTQSTTGGGPTPATPAQTPTASGWTSDLLTILLNGEPADCFGIAQPSTQDLYSSCGSPVRPPFCQSARVPFEVDFLVDRADAPRPPSLKMPVVSVDFDFVTESGNHTTRIQRSDASPRYDSPNLSLKTSFGRDFPIGTTESGRLHVQLTMDDTAAKARVTYSDDIDFIIRPCG